MRFENEGTEAQRHAGMEGGASPTASPRRLQFRREKSGAKARWRERAAVGGTGADFPPCLCASAPSRLVRRAFSLVEFLAVLALMAIIAGAVTLSVRPLMARGKQNAATAEIATLRDALESFHTVTGRYPTNEEGLEFLARPSEAFPEPLLTQAPLDPWSRPYQYNQPGRTEAYEVICLGADGREGGTGADADIVSSQRKGRPRE